MHVNEDHPLICPACKDGSRIDIAARVFVRLTAEGTDPDLARDGSHEFDGDSACRCDGCGHTGTVASFTAMPADDEAPEWGGGESKEAFAEGWDVFSVDRTYRAIQRVDVPDDGDALFESDDSAIAFVRRRAAEGSELHLLAVKIHDAESPTGKTR